MRKLQILITLFLALFLGACESVDSLNKQCENNNSNACISLGFLYDYGKEVEKNTQKAKEFYQKACDLGDKKGCSYYSENQWKVFFDNGYFGFKDQNDSVVIEPKFDLALDFKNGVARVMQDEKFGLIDKNGNFIIEPQFEDILYFSDNVFKAKIASKIVEISKKTYARDSVIKTKWYWKWKLIDSSGKMIFDQKFGDEDHPYLKNNIFFDKGKLKRIYIKGKAGFIDSEGKIIVEPKFDSIQDFKKGFAAVKLKGKWGFVDENGKMIIKAKYDDVADFNEGFAKVKLNKKWGFVDENGEVLIETKFDKVADFENGFARVKSNDKWGLINTKGEFFLKPKFDYIKQLKNAAIVEKDKKYGIVNFDGKILEPQFDYIKDYNNETFLLEKDLRVGLANKETRVIIEPKFDKISYLQNNVFEVVVDEKRGLFDIKSEQFILEPKFDSIFNFSNNLVTASFQGREGIFDIKNRRFVLEPKFDRIYDECRANIIGLNGKYGIINDKAELIVPIKYDDISTCFSNDMYLVKTKGKIGFINKNAEFVIPNQFDVIVSFKYGFMEVKLVRYEKSGLINLKGDLILPFEFDSIYYIEPLAKSSLELSKMRETDEDMSTSKEQIFFAVKKEDKFGVIDNHRKWIVQPQNYLIKYFDKDMGFIISDGLYYGIMNMQGKLIVKPQYEEIYKFSNGFYKISKEGKVGIIDKKGEIVLEPKFDDIDTNDYPFKFKQDTRYGFLDEKAKILFDIKLKAKEWDVYFSYNDVKVFMDKYYLVIEHGRYRIFNMKDNRLASSLSFDFVQEYKKFIIASINDKIGIMDKDLNWLISPKFDNVKGYDNFISVIIADRIGIMDENLNWLILPKFEEFKEFDKNHYKIILDGKIGLLDNNLHTILEPKYDYIGKEFINGFVKIGLNNKYGFISESGEIIEPQFDYVWNFSNDIAEVLVDKETKFINTKGEFIE